MSKSLSNRRSTTAAHATQRPITVVPSYRSYPDIINQPRLRTADPATSRRLNSRQRPTTGGSRNSAKRSELQIGQPYSHELSRLLGSIKREHKFIVEVDCLADYRKLVEIVNLRKTLIDCKSLCTLQQRENRIVQRNACNDKRFRTLVKTLEPIHFIQREKSLGNKYHVIMQDLNEDDEDGDNY